MCADLCVRVYALKSGWRGLTDTCKMRVVVVVVVMVVVVVVGGGSV
jgi:hypothetical protein